jgi:hypothetical protein
MGILENILLASYIIWPAVAIVNATSKRNAEKKDALEVRFNGSKTGFSAAIFAIFLVTWVVAPVFVVRAAFYSIKRRITCKNNTEK